MKDPEKAYKKALKKHLRRTSGRKVTVDDIKNFNRSLNGQKKKRPSKNKGQTAPKTAKPNRAERKKAYAESLKHPLWKAKRHAILVRDGFKCQKCGCGGPSVVLHVHHKQYPAFGQPPWAIGDKHLVTLCELCHNEIHSKRLWRSSAVRPPQ